MKTQLKHNRNVLIILIITSLLPVNSCEVANDLLGNETVAELEGVWNVEETSEIFKSTLETYSVSISPDPDNINGVIIDNFYNVGISVKANVSGTSLSLPQQDAEDGYSLSGSGSISGNSREINLDYVVNDGSAQDDHCSAVYTKL